VIHPISINVAIPNATNGVEMINCIVMVSVLMT
jgi:hypothetical protein